jgi:uncharacterized membrane protein YfcA
MRNIRNIWAFTWGALVGVLGGLIGLGGAEFRLPVLISIFNYRTLPAIIINLVVSLVTVICSFVFRSGVIGIENVVAHFAIIINILAGSLIGSYIGVSYATRINERILNRVVVIFLVLLSFVLIGHNFIFSVGSLQLPSLLRLDFALLTIFVLFLHNFLFLMLVLKILVCLHPLNISFL